MSTPNPRISTVQNQYGQMPHPGSTSRVVGSNVMNNRTPQYGQMPNPGSNPRASAVVNTQASQYVTAGLGPRASGIVNGPRASGVVNGPVSQYGQMPNPGSQLPPQYGRISSGSQSQVVITSILCFFYSLRLVEKYQAHKDQVLQLQDHLSQITANQWFLLSTERCPTQQIL